MRALNAALDRCARDVDAARDGVAVIAVSNEATLPARRAVAVGAARGLVSPMRFAAASPSSIVAGICSARGYRGPALMLPMRPERGLTTARVVAEDWIASDSLEERFAIVLAHRQGSDSEHHVTCEVYGREA